MGSVHRIPHSASGNQYWRSGAGIVAERKTACECGVHILGVSVTS